jgi:hypothetical protein
LSQAGNLLLLRVGVEVAQDGVSFPVQALPRDAPLLGVVADVPMPAEADDGGTGKTRRRDYDAHGVSGCWDAVGGSSASLQGLTPLLSTPATLFRSVQRKSPFTAI